MVLIERANSTHNCSLNSRILWVESFPGGWGTTSLRTDQSAPSKYRLFHGLRLSSLKLHWSIYLPCLRWGCCLIVAQGKTQTGFRTLLQLVLPFQPNLSLLKIKYHFEHNVITPQWKLANGTHTKELKDRRTDGPFSIVVYFRGR